MNRSDALGKISRALAVLTHETRAENLAGFFSKNRVAEDLLVPIFQLVLKAPHLRNLNQGGVNFPYIDLADDISHLALQVTSERSAAKVTETLTNFISGGRHKHYRRLIFFILTATPIRFTRPSKQKWRRICGRRLHFNPATDIVTTLDLFALIAGLSDAKVLAVQKIMARSVIGEEHVDIEGYLNNLSIRQIDYEKNTGKYIPDVFVETRDSKNLVRCFAHPALFFSRTLESLGRLNIRYWNRFLEKAGLPPLPFPDLAAYGTVSTLQDVNRSASQLLLKLADLTGILEKYENLSRENPLPFKVQGDRTYFYEANEFHLQSGLGWGLKRQLKGLSNELAVARARVFILTGRAGQGKTNLVCDFVETFLLKHRVPCAYLSARRLRSMQGADLGDAIQRLLFEGKTTSFAHAAGLVSEHASHIDKPFVLIIDGLNEHHRITEFAEQLEHLIEDVIRYPGFKVFLSCRSEYFRQRFGNLVRTPLVEHVFLLEANESRLEEEAYDEMVVGYFKFFEIREDRVSDHVVEILKKDILLLRFFCEAYGGRGKPAEYRQEFIATIYREKIFEIYLERKLGMARAFLQRFTNQPSPSDEKADLGAVLEHCLAHMLQTWQFADVPLSAIPDSLKNALYALLDEELILRRDIPPAPSIFSPSNETINFTFDEFRDFLLAQYLLHKIYVSDRGAFEQYIGRSDPKSSQVIEGLKRFLFYASRKTENEAFWNFYRDQTWYKDVYDSEIFNVDEKLLRVEDRDIITRALEAFDARAIDFAVQLAVNWHPIHSRLLNLDLLISFVTLSDNVRFDSLIVPAFRTVPHYNEGRSAKGFCKFVTEHVLPRFVPDAKQAEDSLFRFLILLFPVDSGVDLNSESFFVFRSLLDRYPAYAISLLTESLRWGPTRHRPYVWRLLTSGSGPVELIRSLRGEAEIERSRTETAEPVLHREVERFLRRLDAVSESPSE
jgi:hypothetical protein